MNKFNNKYKWYMGTEIYLSFLDKIKLLLGKTYSIYFCSPNGKCNASCSFEYIKKEI